MICFNSTSLLVSLPCFLRVLRSFQRYQDMVEMIVQWRRQAVEFLVISYSDSANVSKVTGVVACKEFPKDSSQCSNNACEKMQLKKYAESILQHYHKARS